ncbi:MAG: phage portal protein [Firmicutes bacterium]|nr:phage portal protein [Bacillota bacterium]
MVLRRIVTMPLKPSYTKERHYKYLCNNIFDRKKILAEENRIYFCDVPMIEYLNNEEEQGDFEQVISLIDAYNILQSDRINDVERFVQAILFLKGFCIEEGDGKRLKEERILQAPGDNTDAKWLANSLDQNSLESVRKSIERDIHKFSFVPAMTDENFSGNASGVAMKYKLLGFEQMTGIKERYMEKGIRERLKIITNMINWSNNLKYEDIEIIFTHNLPVNKEEMADILYKLSSVTDEKAIKESALTLISH